MKRIFFAVVVLLGLSSPAFAGYALTTGVVSTDLAAIWWAHDRAQLAYPELLDFFGADAPIVVQEPAGSGNYYLQWAYYANGTAQATLDNALSKLAAVYPNASYFDHMLNVTGCSDPRSDEQRAADQQEIQQQLAQEEEDDDGDDDGGDDDQQQGQQQGGGQTTVRVENGENVVNVYVDVDVDQDLGDPPASVTPAEGHPLGYEYELQPLQDPTFSGRYVYRTAASESNHALKYSYHFDYQKFKGDFYTKFTEHFPIDDFIESLQYSSSGGATLSHLVLDWDYPEVHIDVDPASWASNGSLAIVRVILGFLVAFETVYMIIKLFK